MAEPLDRDDIDEVLRVLAYADARMEMWGPVYADQLAKDMRALINSGHWPSDEELAAAPRLDMWRVVGTGATSVLVGDVRGHPRIGSRRGITTSRLMLLGVGCARTESRWYQLGVADRSQYRRTLQHRHPRLISDPCIIEVGFGWRGLVSRMLADLDALPETPALQSLDLELGGLRVAFAGVSAPAAARDIVERAEAASLCTCVECGRPGVLRNARGTLAVRCDDHAVRGSSIEGVQ